jgi:bacillithiol biosynthesis cysteine-adding enzyme BshC
LRVAAFFETVLSPVSVNSTDLSTLAVDVRRFPWIRRLAADYAYDFRSVSPFFSGDPANLEAWAQTIARTQAHRRRPSEIARIVGDQQRRRGAPPAAQAAAQKLAGAQTVAVVTGQQAGLFGGPTFTLLKALTALKLAAQVTRDHRVPCVAVFWIDAEDHDWDEVRACQVFDESLSPRMISLASRKAGEPTPVASVRLDDSILEALQALENTLPASEFKAPLLNDLRSIYAPGTGMAEAFGAWLERVLGDRGLVVYDASDAAAKPLACDLFTRELTVPGETGRRAAAAGADLVARGYHAQVNPGDTLALFHIDGGRRPIRQQDDIFVAGDQSFNRPALVAKASAEPAAFSPNVLLRPVVQDSLFPTVCYVAGPNELAYLGQLRGVYEHFGVPMPIIYPRATATLLDSAALRFLSRYNVPIESLQAQDDSVLNAVLASQIPESVNASLDSAGGAVEQSMARVIEAMPALDPTLEGAARSTLGRMQHDLQTLRSKTIQAAKKRDETLRRQFTRTRALVFPGGEPQERAVGFVSFLNQYGPVLVQRLDEQVPLDLGKHWIVVI